MVRQNDLLERFRGLGFHHAASVPRRMNCMNMTKHEFGLGNDPRGNGIFKRGIIPAGLHKQVLYSGQKPIPRKPPQKKFKIKAPAKKGKGTGNNRMRRDIQKSAASTKTKATVLEKIDRHQPMVTQFTSKPVASAKGTGKIDEEEEEIPLPADRLLNRVLKKVRRAKRKRGGERMKVSAKIGGERMKVSAKIGGQSITRFGPDMEALMRAQLRQKLGINIKRRIKGRIKNGNRKRKR